MLPRTLRLILICLFIIIEATTSTAFMQAPPQDYRIVFRSDIDLNSPTMIVNSDGTGLQFLPFNNGENYDAACSLDGNFLAYLTPGGIEVRDAQFNLVSSIPGSQLSRLPRLSGLSISIGGNKIAYVKADANGYQNIYISNPDGSNVTQVTTGSSFNTSPAISPDGTKILFESNRHTTVPNKREIFVVNADGTNLTQLTNTGGVNVSANWSPDGSRIVFTSDRLDSISLNIYLMNADGTNVTALTALPSGNYQPSWSPNGNEIAYVSTQDTGRGDNDIYVMNSDGSNVRRITNDGYHNEIPCWIDSAIQPTPTATFTFTPTLTPTPTATLTGTTYVTQIGSTGSDQNENGTTWESGRTTLNTLVAVPLEQ